jgi:hypothetical protein
MEYAVRVETKEGDVVTLKRGRHSWPRYVLAAETR